MGPTPPGTWEETRWRFPILDERKRFLHLRFVRRDAKLAMTAYRDPDGVFRYRVLDYTTGQHLCSYSLLSMARKHRLGTPDTLPDTPKMPDMMRQLLEEKNALEFELLAVFDALGIPPTAGYEGAGQAVAKALAERRSA